MRSRIKVHALLLIIVLSMSSCVNIVNLFKINADKSGTAFIGIEINAVSGLLDLASEYIDNDFKKKITVFPAEADEKLKGLKGVSNIKSYLEVNSGKLGVEFDFKNPKALNTALYALLDKERKCYFPDIIKIRKHKVKIRDVSFYIKEYIEDNNEEMSPLVINYIKYNTVVIFPKKIKSVKNNTGFISYDKKTYSNIVPIKDIMEDKAVMGAIIKY